MSDSGENHLQGILELVQCSQNFRSVKLFWQPVTNAVLSELVQSPNLTSLHIFNTLEQKLDSMILAECKNLERFVADDEITEDALVAIIEANPKLKHLDLSSCQVCTDRVFLAIVANCQGLVSLAAKPDAISPEVILQLKTLKDLKEFNFVCDNLSNEFLGVLFQLTHLTSLTLYASIEFSVEAFRGIKALTNLEVLDLIDVVRLNKELVDWITIECKCLKTFLISGNSPPYKHTS